jgi:alpha-L-arabinofuranosidase
MPPSALRMRMRSALALTLAVLATGVVALRAQSVPPAAYLTFDEGTGTVAYDSSGNGNDATLLGDAGWTPGIVGPFALSLPGTQGSYADIPAVVVDTTQSFTVAAWVRLNSVGGFQTFVSEDSGYQSAFFLQKRGNTNTFTFTLPFNGTNGPGTAVFADSGIVPAVGRWYHVAGVYDAAAHSASIYVNGALADSNFAVFSSPANGNTGIGHGQYANGYVDWVDGAIDDVRLYAAALSAADVLEVARAGDPSLIGAPPVEPATLQIDAEQPGSEVNPSFYGLMIEEINHSLDGGLYGELIRNRAFQDDPITPAHWSLVQDNGGAGSIALDITQPVEGTALTTSLRVEVVDVAGASGDQRVGAANDGYWGIPVKPFTTYRATFWAKASWAKASANGDSTFSGPLTLDIETSDGTTVYAQAQVPEITTSWAKYTALLRTSFVPPDENTRFVIATDTPGAFWVTQVSLFRPTYHDRPNGNRIDVMRKLADMKPAFLRLPGGNYLEGNTIGSRFEWKNTIGPIEQRAGHPGTWSYRSDDGLGLLEFLEWCEDLRMQPLLAVWAGYALNGTHVNPGPDLEPYVQDALDEIEYVTGATDTPWGARRTADGHPAPFPLQYVEIGNEDNFDRSGSYEGRFAQFYDAIKAAYPDLQVIATRTVASRTPDLVDEHYYRTPRAFENDVHHYDGHSRTGPKIFVGEWASQEGVPTPNLHAALGDAAWLTGLERNSDLVLLESYAPLLVNVNPGAYQWPTNLIGYDALTSYGSPAYYAQAMFSSNHGDVVLPTTLVSTGGSRVYASATRDSNSGTVYLKMVNAAADPQPLHITVNGGDGIEPEGRAVVLAGRPEDTNDLSNPRKVVPMTVRVSGVGPSFDYSLAPYSITVLRLTRR